MIQDFDIIDFLDDQGISYSNEGKNISEGWIGTSCPFCFDPSNHLGIHLTSKNLTCWRCGKHTIIEYIQEIMQMNKTNAFKILRKYQNRGKVYKLKEEMWAEKVILPKTEKEMPKLHQDYLLERNFDPNHITKKYDVQACHYLGDYNYRLIIPIYMDSELVTFTSRDVTGKAKQKYRHCPNDQSVIPIKHCIYNIDRAREKVIVVEGVTDVWRIGEGAVALFGTQYTNEQIFLLSQFKKIFVFFDPEKEAQKQAWKLANNLSMTSEVELLFNEKGDPADMTEEEVMSLRYSIFGY